MHLQWTFNGGEDTQVKPNSGGVGSTLVAAGVPSGRLKLHERASVNVSVVVRIDLHH